MVLWHYFWALLPWHRVLDNPAPLEDYRFHRYDLIKSKLQMTNVIEPVLKQVETALRSGHSVWIIGKIHMPSLTNLCQSICLRLPMDRKVGLTGLIRTLGAPNSSISWSIILPML